MEERIQEKSLRDARKQFCLDIGLDYETYLQNPYEKCYIQKAKYTNQGSYLAMDGVRHYKGCDGFFKAMICRGQLFCVADERIYDWAVHSFSDIAPEWFCKFDNLRKIDQKLLEFGRRIKDTHVYFLPGEKEKSCLDKEGDFSYLWYEKEDIEKFRSKNRFTSALCFSETQPDVLAVAAVKEISEEERFCQEKMAGMAGISEDGQYLWQIGINVAEEYRGKGLAVGLVTRLKEEVQNRGYTPFYGTSESHTISQTVGLKAGFVPAWTEIFVEKENR